MAVLTTLSSAVSQMFKTIPMSLVVENFGIVWVLGGLWDGRVYVTKWGRGVTNGKVLALDQVALAFREFWRITRRLRGAMSWTSFAGCLLTSCSAGH